MGFGSFTYDYENLLNQIMVLSHCNMLRLHLLILIQLIVWLSVLLFIGNRHCPVWIYVQNNFMFMFVFACMYSYICI